MIDKKILHGILSLLLLLALSFVAVALLQNIGPDKEVQPKPAFDNLSSKVLFVSDLPNGTMNYTQKGSNKYLMLKDNRQSQGYQDIRIVDVLIVGERGSMCYVIDKSGAPLPFPGSVPEDNPTLHSKFLVDGYHYIYVENNKVYGTHGSRTVYIGDL